MNAAPAEPSNDPVPRRPPRNYLQRGERRKLLWQVMPVALVVLLLLTVVEQVWFPRRPAARPRQIDTTLESIAGPRPEADAVVIAREAEPFIAPVGELSAPADELAKVRDDTFFREDDLPAWTQTWLTIRSGSIESFLRANAARITFSELFGQPRSFRGRLVRFRGTLHRLERLKAPANHYDIEHYWQGWLEPADGPATPIVVQFLRLPAGMPTGMKIHEQVEVIGYFFKRYAYSASDTIRVAPLVMSLEPVWEPLPPVAPGGSWLGTAALATGAALVVAVALGMRLANAGRTVRPSAEPVDLDAHLAGVRLTPPEAALVALARQADEPGGPAS